jgi:hypothetical protein
VFLCRDLSPTGLPILMQRQPHFTLEQLMVVVKIPTQELIQKGEAEGRRAEAAST